MLTERIRQKLADYRRQLATARANLHKTQARKHSLEAEGYEYESRGEIAPQEWLDEMRDAEAEYDKAYDIMCEARHQLQELEDDLAYTAQNAD